MWLVLSSWNSLPLHIRSATSLSIFKNMLKTYLFSRSYFTDCFAEYEQRTLYGALLLTSRVTAPYKLSFYLLFLCYFIFRVQRSSSSIYCSFRYLSGLNTLHYILSSARVCVKRPQTSPLRKKFIYRGSPKRKSLLNYNELALYHIKACQ